VAHFLHGTISDAATFLVWYKCVITKDEYPTALQPSLRINARLLRTILHNFPNGSVNVFDGDLRYLYAEGRGLAAVGLTSEHLLGKRLHEVYSHESAEYVTPYYEHALAGNDTEFELEFCNHCYRVNASPLRDDNGAVWAVVAVAFDITPRKRLEQLRDQFLASVAHDLKTPIGAVKGIAQLQLRRARKAGSESGSDQSQAFERIESLASDMARQIDDLFDLVRLHADQALVLDTRPTDLVEVVREQVRRHVEISENHEIIVQAELATLIGMWDRRRIELVVANLLSNAIRYSPEGGTVTIRLNREEASTGAWAVAAVTDFGIGIPPAELDRVFERFYRASNVTSKFEGSGIGLAGVRQIVERHSGTVSVESQLGLGSTFTVRLPLLNQAP
jgi:two-component system, OmpR family, phosphate regulon sensor histidine kinase PhoR